MGGNGAHSYFKAKTLSNYTGVRFEQVDVIDNVKVIQVANRSNTAIPVEAFTSEMYYVVNPKTGLIEHITFYDKKTGDIKHSIDLEFNPDGSFKPYREFTRKGKLRSEGSHLHRKWPKDKNGNKGRVSHDKNNIEPVNRYYMRYVNKAIRYNAKIRNNGK